MDSKQIQRQRIMKFRMAVTLQNYAFACHDLDMRQHQFDSILQMASIVRHCECDQRDNLQVRVVHLIGMDLLKQIQNNFSKEFFKKNILTEGV